MSKDHFVSEFPQKEFDHFRVLVKPYSFGRASKNISTIAIRESNPRFSGENPIRIGFPIPFIYRLEGLIAIQDLVEKTR